ncbi:Cup [Operophtera brumata]|uniref:Cup n=1 Tax=Operophtera brumata TaxID=104452 RepID=A0A0L7LBC5_OPEBR|nr:Cup [Operophtera brumata]
MDAEQKHGAATPPTPESSTATTATGHPSRSSLQTLTCTTGLKSGEITAQHLMQQLGNPGLQSRHREMLLTILRLQQQHHQRQACRPVFRLPVN